MCELFKEIIQGVLNYVWTDEIFVKFILIENQNANRNFKILRRKRFFSG